jgi:hypothetical protein
MLLPSELPSYQVQELQLSAQGEHRTLIPNNNTSKNTALQEEIFAMKHVLKMGELLFSRDSFQSMNTLPFLTTSQERHFAYQK